MTFSALLVIGILIGGATMSVASTVAESISTAVPTVPVTTVSPQVEKMKLLWTFDVPPNDVIPDGFSLVADQNFPGVLFKATPHELYATIHAMNVSSGATMWTSQVSAPNFRGQLVLANGLLIFAAQYGNITAVDPYTGKPVWVSIGSFIGTSVAEDQGSLLACSQNETSTFFNALSLSTGRSRYTTVIPANFNGVNVIAAPDGSAAAVCGYSTCNILNATTGALLQKGLGVDAYLNGAFCDGLFITTNYQTQPSGSVTVNLVAFTPASGETAWNSVLFHVNQPTDVIVGVVEGGIIVVRTLDSVKGFQCATGIQAWNVTSIFESYSGGVARLSDGIISTVNGLANQQLFVNATTGDVLATSSWQCVDTSEGTMRCGLDTSLASSIATLVAAASPNATLRVATSSRVPMYRGLPLAYIPIIVDVVSGAVIAEADRVFSSTPAVLSVSEGIAIFYSIDGIAAFQFST